MAPTDTDETPLTGPVSASEAEDEGTSTTGAPDPSTAPTPPAERPLLLAHQIPRGNKPRNKKAAEDHRSDFEAQLVNIPRTQSKRMWRKEQREKLMEGNFIGKPSREKSAYFRGPTPTVSNMLDDAYQALAMQLRQYRQLASLEKWDSPMATAFKSLVSSLVALQETERKNAAGLAVGALTDAELQKLAAQSKRLLSEGEPTRDIT